MRALASFLVATTIVACRPSGTTASPAPTSASSAATVPSASASAAPTASTAPSTHDALGALPKPAGRRGAIRVVGYPKTVGTGMNDPADWVGFTTDGSEYGYCGNFGGRDPQMTKCETVLRDGSSKKRDSEKGDFYSAAAMKELSAWRTSAGLTHLSFKNGFELWMAKPLTGEWDFSDVTIGVNTIAGDGTTTSAVVKLGGSVDGEPAVYPVVLQAKPIGPGATFHTAWVNDLSLPPDGTEIGAIGGFLCAEWCDDFVLYRKGTGAFASLVYNDTGFRHHQKGEYARAAELFLRATFADPTAKLPPYNLACAWARLGDARAKDALAVAIERDPTARKRATTDADFAGVKTADWFVAATSP